MSPEPFLESAGLLLEGRFCFCCSAIDWTGDDDHSELFENTFKPEGISDDSSWFGPAGEPENQEARIMALLLCAEMCKPTKNP